MCEKWGFRPLVAMVVVVVVLVASDVLFSLLEYRLELPIKAPTMDWLTLDKATWKDLKPYLTAPGHLCCCMLLLLLLRLGHRSCHCVAQKNSPPMYDPLLAYTYPFFWTVLARPSMLLLLLCCVSAAAVQYCSCRCVALKKFLHYVRSSTDLRTLFFYGPRSAVLAAGCRTSRYGRWCRTVSAALSPLLCCCVARCRRHRLGHRLGLRLC